MTDTVQLMSIGEFSSRSRLRVRMLRHYGDHGILEPAEVDPASGYRRTHPSNSRRRRTCAACGSS